MNLEQKFKDIVAFLRPYESIWNREIIFHYPNHREGYEDLLLDCKNLTTQDLRDLCAGRVPTTIENSKLHDLILEIQQLSKVPFHPLEPESKADVWGWMKVKSKKKHEIQHLEPILLEKIREQSLTHVVDIGGGIGYFSQILANYHGLKCTSLDGDPNLQNTGKKRNSFNQRDDAELVNYVEHWFDGPCPSILPYFHNKAISLGVHTCGPLSNRHFDCFLASESQSMINFGCCYNRLSGTKDFNISSISREYGLDLQQTALTLATRSHADIDSMDFDFKLNVKRQRYTLHRYFYHAMGMHRFISVGSTKKNIYANSFSAYAQFMFDKIGFCPKDIDDQELNDFANTEENKKFLNEIVLMGVIRLIFGRLVEIYLLLDRALYLKDKGINVEMYQVFNEDRSPRNIAIYAKKP